MYCKPNIVRVIKSRRLRWAGHIARMKESRSAFKILTGKPTRKRPLGRHRLRWGKNSIRVDLKLIGVLTRNWVDSVQDRDYLKVPVNAALNLQVLLTASEFTSLSPILLTN